MNQKVKDLLRLMITHSFSAKNHFPENLLLNPRKKHLNKKDRKDFEKDYNYLIEQEIILRVWKRTGKGSDWHIGLNPKMRDEAEKIINE